MLFKITLTILLIFFFLASCTNPFSVRDPEKPDPKSTTVIYDPAFGPDTVLVNFEKAIENKNLIEYMNVFVSANLNEPHSFIFEPEPYFQNDFIEPWTREDEQTYFDQLTKTKSGDFPKLSLIFKNKPLFTPIIAGSDEDSLQTNSIEYSLQADFGDSSFTYSGVNEFKLFKSQNDQLWYIYYWRDNAINQSYNTSWTYLKTLYK